MNTLKQLGKPILTGVVIALLLALIMLKVTIDFQWLLFIGAVLFFIGGWMNRNSWKKAVLIGVTIIIPFGLLFLFLVVSEIRGLWYFIVVYLVSTILGLKAADLKTRKWYFIIPMVAVMILLAVFVVPLNLRQSLTSDVYKELPEFELDAMNGNSIGLEDFGGKTIVLDFFGTWCKPCIKELVELDKVQEGFSNDPNVAFYVVNADLGGDTPEKFNEFINENRYNFNYAYDHNSELFRKLDLINSGLPSLLVIDKEGVIRFLHVGYNTAETHFSDDLINVISSYR